MRLEQSEGKKSKWDWSNLRNLHIREKTLCEFSKCAYGTNLVYEVKCWSDVNEPAGQQRLTEWPRIDWICMGLGAYDFMQEKWTYVINDQCWNNRHNLGKGLRITYKISNHWSAGTRKTSQIANITRKGVEKLEDSSRLHPFLHAGNSTMNKFYSLPPEKIRVSIWIHLYNLCRVISAERPIMDLR
jgi:hypothetical protein